MIKAGKREWEKEKEEKAQNFNAPIDLRSGVKRDRGCTDILCLLLFFAFIGAMTYCCILGLKDGHTSKIIAPVDG